MLAARWIVATSASVLLVGLLFVGRDAARSFESSNQCNHGYAPTLITPDLKDSHIVIASNSDLATPAYVGSLARVDAHDRVGNVFIGSAVPMLVMATALVALEATDDSSPDAAAVAATAYPTATCTGGGTCQDSVSCKHPTWCTLLFETCSSTFTCNGGTTCGTITCLGLTCASTWTCKTSTCAGTTCTSSATCSGSPTCPGYLTCSNTCQGTVTCGGYGCPILTDASDDAAADDGADASADDS